LNLVVFSISSVYGAFSHPPVSKEHEFNKNIPLNFDTSKQKTTFAAMRMKRHPT
jgi:hypothetical protein